MTELEELRYFERQCLEMAEQSPLADARRALRILAGSYAKAAKTLQQRSQLTDTRPFRRSRHVLAKLLW